MAGTYKQNKKAPPQKGQMRAFSDVDSHDIFEDRIE